MILKFYFWNIIKIDVRFNYFIVSTTVFSNQRLSNQFLLGEQKLSVGELVSRMGAIQAQDFAMAKWALGIRIKGLTNDDVETAYNNATFLRIHVMRPTWHFVAPEDIQWMLELTAPRIRISLRTRDKEFGITEDMYEKSNATFLDILKNDNHLTREELVDCFEQKGLRTDNFKLSHYTFRAEIDGLICNGRLKNGKQTVALLDERVPQYKKYCKEEALALLATKYFTSHAPATLQDFVWWSGLSMSDARLVLNFAQSQLVSEKRDSHIFWRPAEYKTAPENSVLVLPAFDEFIISYRSRFVSIVNEHNAKVISTNGIFKPVIVYNGRVVGYWSRTLKKDRCVVESTLFDKADKNLYPLIENAFVDYGLFLSKKIEMTFR